VLSRADIALSVGRVEKSGEKTPESTDVSLNRRQLKEINVGYSNKLLENTFHAHARWHSTISRNKSFYI
jgi:hypothetical protein